MALNAPEKTLKLEAVHQRVGEDPLVNGKGLNPCENIVYLYHTFLAGATSSLPSK